MEAPTQTAPAWFTEALAAPRESRTVGVAGCPIHYYAWGRPGDRPLLLVHGGAAHAQWWTYLGPLLQHAGRHVVALDLSGHGDSGWRERYVEGQWVEELFAVAEHAGLAGPPTLIGHSMGGIITMHALATHGADLAQAIIVDAPVERPRETRWRSGSNPFVRPRAYPDLEAAMARFKLVPDQPCENRWIVRHVAEHSARQTPEGWAWKFDPRIFTSPRVPPDTLLVGARCPVAIIRGERSVILTRDVADHMSRLAGGAPLVEIPGAHHHVLLDQPLPLVDALERLLV